MEDLRKLVDIINQRKQRQFPLLDLKSINENSSKENIFYRHIKKGDFKTDDDAAMVLYGTNSNDDRFRMLKSRLKQKLLNHLFFLDLTDNNQRAAVTYEQECIDYLHQAKMLEFADEAKIARGLVMKALTMAQRCEFTSHIIRCHEALLKIYSENCQPHLFEDTRESLQKTRALYAVEEDARAQFLLKKMMILKSVNSRKKNLDSADVTIAYFEQLWDKTKSYNILQYLIQLKILVKELRGEFKEIIPILKEAETGKYKSTTLNVYRLEQQKIILSLAFAYFRAKEYDYGLRYIQKHINLFDQSSGVWIQLNETHFLTATFSEKFDVASDIIDSVFKSDYFENLSREDTDKWNLYYAYLHWTTSGSTAIKNNYAFLLENDPENVAGKEGFNLATLILQFMCNLEQRNMARLVEIRDELKGYMANHFKENFSYRSRTFYKLLNIVVVNKLDVQLIQSRARYLLKKLALNQIVGSLYPEFEIIPYEVLWERIVEELRIKEQRSI